MRFTSLSIAIFTALLLTSPLNAAPKVVASIKPVHALVSAVMEGVGVPHLIVRGGATPHTFSLRPSDASALADADLVLWVGPDLENFLDGTIETLAPDARLIELAALPEMLILPLREDANFEHHEHGDEHEDHADAHGEHDEYDGHDGHEEHDAHSEHDEHGEHDDDHTEADMHLWLDPQNAMVIVSAATDALVELDAENTDLYRANAEATIARLQQLSADIADELAPFSDVPFVTFHDAYQYFESRFGVSAAGAITLNPESQPGARRIAEVRETIARLGAVCIFTEPQFEPALVAVVAEGSDARSGTLDPIGADLQDGPELYFNLIRQMADNMRACLAP